MECLTISCHWNNGENKCTLSFIEVYGTPDNPKSCKDRTMRILN